MRIPWLEADTPFPPAGQALEVPDGLLAAGADLSVARLRQAYGQGIFPWFSAGDPVLWWSPDPRMILACAEFSPPHALRKQLRQIERAQGQGDYTVCVQVDTAFADVIAACAAPRTEDGSTWIVPAMRRVYEDWHLAGAVHSIETWMEGRLAGGLYGVSLGSMFFGESMFTRRSNASKIALAHLVRFLARHGVQWIDCQQQTAHLASLGARPRSREAFLSHIAAACQQPVPPWQPGWLDSQGRLHPLPVPSHLDTTARPAGAARSVAAPPDVFRERKA